MSSLARDGIDWLSISLRLPRCSRGSSLSRETAPSAAESRMRSRYSASSVPSRFAASSWSTLALRCGRTISKGVYKRRRVFGCKSLELHARSATVLLL